MTDYDNCVNDLREYLVSAEISAPLEAQAKEIAEKDARIAVLEAALTKAATRLKDIHSKGRASRSQYKIYAEEAFAALKGDKPEQP